MAAKKGKDGKSVSSFMSEKTRHHVFDVAKKRQRTAEIKLTREETKEEIKAIYEREKERIKHVCNTNGTVPQSFNYRIIHRGQILHVNYIEIY